VSDDRAEVERAGKAALDKVTEQLEWRGPNGWKAGHVVLKREVAEAIGKYFNQLVETIADHEADENEWMQDEREAGDP